jgi:hypothetical protein
MNMAATVAPFRAVALLKAIVFGVGRRREDLDRKAFQLVVLYGMVDTFVVATS